MLRKYGKYAVILFLVLLGLGIYLVPRPEKKKVFDRTISYSRYTYRPYDTRFFYEKLKENVGVSNINYSAPDAKILDREYSLYVICSPQFLPSEKEISAIYDYIAQGNIVFLSSFSVNPAFLQRLPGSKEEVVFKNKVPKKAFDDSLTIKMSRKVWQYPGSGVKSNVLECFADLDSAVILGSTKGHGPAVLQYDIGDGSLFIQIAPMALSNYFLLHKENYGYLGQLATYLQLDTRELIWDEYYRSVKELNTQDADREHKGESYMWKMIMKHPPLKWAVFTFLGGLLLFVLNHYSRLREPLQVLPPNKNTTLEFTEAISELYWQHKDHAVIAHKITLWLQDVLGSKYKLAFKEFKMSNLGLIATKTQKPEEDIRKLLDTIEEVTKSPTDQNLQHYYKLVYKFIH